MKYFTVKQKKLTELNQKLRNIADNMLSTRKQSLNEREIFSIYAFGKAYKTHFMVIKSCDEGYGEDAAILVRSIFELLVTIKYILQEKSNERAIRYFEYDWILRNKMYAYAKTKDQLIKMMEERELANPEGETRAKVETEAKRVQEKYQYNNKGWSNKNVYEMSEAVGLADVYKTVYALQSQFVHNATRTMSDYLRPTVTGFGVVLGPSDNWIDESLIAGFDFMFQITYEYMILLNMQGSFENHLRTLRDEWIQSFEKTD